MHGGTQVSWADHTFNPWLSDRRTLGSVDGLIASLQEAPELGDPASVVQWEDEAGSFEGVHGRRRRVFAGPWCQPLSTRELTERTSEFVGLVRDSPSIDWLTMVEAAEPRDSLGAQLPSNLWLGITVSGRIGANSALKWLRRSRAKSRFVVTSASAGDLGDLELEGVDWIVIRLDGDVDLGDGDRLASIKLQAMCYGIPVWFDSPGARTCLHRPTSPFDVREEPRAKRPGVR